MFAIGFVLVAMGLAAGHLVPVDAGRWFARGFSQFQWPEWVALGFTLGMLVGLVLMIASVAEILWSSVGTTVARSLP